jgi:hypothetical protein
LICFSFLAARILNGACILRSSFLIACSVSIISVSRYFSIGFSMLYCSLLLSSTISSFVNLISVRFTVLG